MKIVVAGGGFGGVKVALELAKDKKNKITLISDRPDFQYYPALYSSATGHSHLESWVPLSKIFAGKSNVTIKLDKLTKIDIAAKRLTGQSGETYVYDKCVMALGSVTTYFGIKGLDAYAYGIKSADEIRKLKQHILSSIVEKGEVDKHYVVVGAGPTGVELAAALGGYLRELCDQYGLDDKIRVDLIEAAPRVLPRMHEKASARVARRLKELGVNVQVGKAVQEETADEIMVSGKPIKSHTVIWTSGVTNNPFFKENASQFTLDQRGKIVVDQHMQAAKDVYVIGDNAVTPFSGLAQTALHDAKFVAKNIRHEQHGEILAEYKTVRPIVIVPVGERWAVFEWYGIRLYGWTAAILRRLADLVGYSDMLPLGQALGVWRASFIENDDMPPNETLSSKTHR